MSSMAIILVVVSAAFAGALGLHAYKQFNIRRRQRISENEYAVAVAVWEYGRLVKGEIEDAIRKGAGVIDFARIAIPHSHGYRVSLELTASYFRVYATPDRYARTGRLSFVTDDSLTVRAADREGEPATPDDPEYKGDSVN
jgi:hypothetical protein